MTWLCIVSRFNRSHFLSSWFMNFMMIWNGETSRKIVFKYPMDTLNMQITSYQWEWSIWLNPFGTMSRPIGNDMVPDMRKNLKYTTTNMNLLLVTKKFIITKENISKRSYRPYYDQYCDRTDRCFLWRSYIFKAFCDIKIVKMHSMVGPDHAKQKQIHKNIVYDPTYVRRSIRTKTFEFPYSETFDVVSL